MVNYDEGKIYKIVCNTTGLVYYGSTCEPTLAKRLAVHNYDYKRFLKGKRRPITSFQILENKNYEIVLEELCPCKTKDELHSRERFFIENNECVNKFIPKQTRKEYRDKTKDAMKEYQRKNYVENKEEIQRRNREYRERNKEKLNEARKKWVEKNREKVNEYSRNYRKKTVAEIEQPK